MIKRILQIIKRDLKSGMRDAMIIYIVAAPILIALLMRLFIPSVNSASMQFAVLEEDHHLYEHLRQYGKVENFENIDELQDRIKNVDDVVGIVGDQGSFRVILEGTESKGVKGAVENILLVMNDTSDLPLDVSITDIGWEISLVGSVSAVSLILLATLLGGMLSGLNIVEERQMKTINAVRVSPVNTMEFLIAKCTPGIIIPIFQSLLTFAILGFTDINWMMAVIICIASSLIGLIVGVLLGVINTDPLTAVAGLKVMMLPMSATILGALLLPDKWMPVLYWIPYYWTYQGVMDIIYKTSTWSSLIFNSGMIVILTIVVFFFLRKRIQAGLQSA